MSIYRAGVDVDLVGAGPGAGEAGVGLEAGAAGVGLETGAAGVGLEAGVASVVEVLVVDGDGGGGLDIGSRAVVMGSILPLKGRMTSAMTSSESDSLGL